MRTIKPLILGIALTVSMAVMVSAQQAGNLSSLGLASHNVTIEVRDVEIGALLSAIATKEGIDLQITPEAEALLRKQISADFYDLTPATVFSTFLEVANCSYEVVGEKAMRITAN